MRFFDSEGPFMQLLNKTGQIIIINLLWIIGCIPVITIGTSTIAMYYAVVKAVRAECGYPANEFFRAYRMNVLKGIPLEILVLAALALLYLNRNYVSALGTAGGLALFIVYDVLAIIFAAMLMYAVPVLSRFQVSFLKYIKMIFVMSFRFLPTTAVLAAGLAGIVILIGFYPITVLVAPGIWCYLASFLTERVMRHFMPPKQSGDYEWYYDLKIAFDRKDEEEQQEQNGSIRKNEKNKAERKEGK